MKKSVYKRKYLNDYCEHKGMEDLCDGCNLEGTEYGCNFNSASDAEIDEMFDVLTGGKEVEEVIECEGEGLRHTEEG